MAQGGLHSFPNNGDIMRKGRQGRSETPLIREGDPIDSDNNVTRTGGVGLVGHGLLHMQGNTPMRGVFTFTNSEAMRARNLHVSDSPSEGGKPRADQSLRKRRRLRFDLEDIVAFNLDALTIPPT